MVYSFAPFVPTDHSVVRKMLEIAKVGVDDVVFDLGCGDGRILISAVRDYGVKKAVGYEMNKQRYEEAFNNIIRVSLDGRIEIFNEDLMKADLREATVVTLYLTTSGNAKLSPKLERETPDGTRIVSHDFSIEGWKHQSKISYAHHLIFLYNIPQALSKRARKARTDYGH